MSEHDEDNELIALLQADKSPAARAIAKIFIRQKRMNDVVLGDPDTKRVGLVEDVTKLKKGYTYLTVALVITAASGAAAAHSVIFKALTAIIP
jgi:hypothetical protein